ncbi:MAG: IS630 family transposase [Candidatus Dormibacteraceae bacterium]
MIYVREPTIEEREELRRMMRQAVGRVSERAHMVLLSADHHSVPEIARLFGVSRATIRFWLRRFDQQGPAGLDDERRSGRPRKADENVGSAVARLMTADPVAHGYLATFWTVSMVVLALVSQVGVPLGETTVRGLLHHLGLRWGRPRLAMPRKVDPDKAAKQWAIVQAVVDAEPPTVILYADESRVQLLPLLRAMWHFVGQQLRIPTPGTNVTRAVFGALNHTSGQWTYLIRDHMKAPDFIAFLDHLWETYPEVPIILIVDNYGNHTAHLVSAWLVEHPRLRLLFLPKYCSHLNPVEPIWRRLKEKVAANRLHGSISILVEAIETFFAAMTPEQTLIWSAA